MKRLMLSICAVLLCAASVNAQVNATPTNHLAWTEVGQSVAVAQGATYNVYADGSATSTSTLSGVVCVAAGADASCTANFPAFTPGTHTLVISQAMGTVESGKSGPPTSFTFVIVVTPSNVIIK